MNNLDLLNEIKAKYTNAQKLYKTSHKLVLEIKQTQGLCVEYTLTMFCARGLVHRLKYHRRYVKLECENCIFIIEPVIRQTDLWIRYFRYFPKNNVKYSPFSLTELSAKVLITSKSYLNLNACEIKRIINLGANKNILMKIGVPKCQAIVPFIVILMEQIQRKIKPNHQILFSNYLECVSLFCPCMKGMINQNCMQVNSNLCHVCEIMNRNDYLQGQIHTCHVSCSKMIDNI